MPTQVSYTEAQQHFDELCNVTISTGQPIEITRDGAESVSLISTAELQRLLETVYLFQSHQNASRLLDALNRTNTGENPPRTIESLRQEFGLVEEEKASA